MDLQSVYASGRKSIYGSHGPHSPAGNYKYPSPPPAPRAGGRAGRAGRPGVDGRTGAGGGPISTKKAKKYVFAPPLTATKKGCRCTLGEETILGTCSWKNEYGNLGNKLKTRNSLKMAPQAEPLCAKDLHTNSLQNRGIHVPRCLI